MFAGTTELAENKLLILYIFSRINMPMSNSHITQIILENNLLNYFGLQQYLSELIDSGLLFDSIDGKKHMLSLSEKGSNSLELFISRIPDKKKKIIDTYFIENIDLIKRDISVVSEYVLEGKKPMVRLALKSNTTTMIEIKIPAEDNSEVQEISQHWKENYEEIYAKIMNLFNR
jgi:predicted transcriptional regulator